MQRLSHEIPDNKGWDCPRLDFDMTLCVELMSNPGSKVFVISDSMMMSSNGNIFHITGPLYGEFPSQRPVMWSFDVFFDLRLNKRLSKQSRRQWFETPSCSSWCNSNGTIAVYNLNAKQSTFPSLHNMQIFSIRLIRIIRVGCNNRWISLLICCNKSFVMNSGLLVSQPTQARGVFY